MIADPRTYREPIAALDGSDADSPSGFGQSAPSTSSSCSA